VLSETTPRPWPTLSTASQSAAVKRVKPCITDKLNDLQQSLLVAAAGAKRKRAYSKGEVKDLFNKVRLFEDVMKYNIL